MEFDRRSRASRARRLARSASLLVVVGLFHVLPLGHALPVGGALDVAAAHADVSSALAGADEAEKPRVDAADVYYGNAANWKKPAEVDADAVYAEIPEYKKILADGLEPDSPKYQLLMNRASKRFVAAVRSAARAGQHDLVARTGAVKGVQDVPDLTAAVIEKL